MRTLSIVFLLMLMGCGGVTNVTGSPNELAQARALWAAKGLRSYRFTLQRVAFTLPEYAQPVTITVRDGVAVDAPEHLKAYDTVEKLYNTIQAAQEAKVAALTTEFNPDGSPRSIVVDVDTRLADDEYSLIITNLEAL